MRRGLLVAPLLAAALLLTGCSETGVQANGTDGDNGVTEWDHPTETVSFTGPTADGSRFSSAAARGDVLVVNFWYADCGPCNAEAPVLRGLAQRYADKGVRFVGINTNDGSADAQAYDRHYRIPYPSVLDQSNGGAARLAFQKTVPPAAIPSTIVLDRKGRVVARIIGQADGSVLGTLIDDAVDGQAA